MNQGKARTNRKWGTYYSGFISDKVKGERWFEEDRWVVAGDWSGGGDWPRNIRRESYVWWQTCWLFWMRWETRGNEDKYGDVFVIVMIAVTVL